MMRYLKEICQEKSIMFTDGWKGYSNEDGYFLAHG